MTQQVNLYLSRIVGKKILSEDLKCIGVIKDLLVDAAYAHTGDEPTRPVVCALRVKTNEGIRFLDVRSLIIEKQRSGHRFICSKAVDIPAAEAESRLHLVENVLDKQIVDINGRKLVRVNDVRLVYIESGLHAIAVDVGLEGILRRIGIETPFKSLFSLFKLHFPSEFILWDDVAAVDLGQAGIRLSKTQNKLKRLHPSDLADIIEDLGNVSKTTVFAALDEEHAADVLEEMEEDEQINLIERLPVEKAADVLEKMPADEAADIIEELEADKAEKLLQEMDQETSEEVRELLGYSDSMVGSIMTTDYLAFRQYMSVNDTLRVLRTQKPEADVIYSLFITDDSNKLISSVSLRDIVVSEPDIPLTNIMDKNPQYVYDTDKLDSLAEIVEKYDLLAIPVIDESKHLQGVVVIDDIVEDLLDKRKTE